MNAWGQELNDLIRAFSGAYIFGVPLLFTMEMWWIGQYAEPWKLLTFLGVAFLANLGLTYAAGFKRSSAFRTTVNQAVDAVAVGIVAASVVLLVLNRIKPGDPLDSVLGKIVIQAVPLSIGASVANQLFGRHGEKSRQGEAPPDGTLRPWQALFADVGATIIGGIFVGFSITPTDEIPMLAAEVDLPHLLAIVAFSLAVSYGIVFASGFDEAIAEGPFQHPLTETALAYAVSLAVAAASLFLLDRIGPEDPPLTIIESTIVLGLPMTIGGAAGRLVI